MQASTLTGKIDWFNQAKGFGVATSPGTGEVFLLSRNLTDSSQVAKLVPEAHILFSVIKEKHRKTGEDRLVANNITFAASISPTEQQGILPKENSAPAPHGSADHQLTGFEFVPELLKANDAAFNKRLVKTLANGLGKINNDNRYKIAKQLANYNQTVAGSYYDKLNQILYEKSTNQYKLNLWLDGIYDKCSLSVIENAYLKADVALRLNILTMCDDTVRELLDVKILPSPTKTLEEVYFSGIRNIILNEISKAKENIFVAVAWFTNHQLFDALCQKVIAGVNVELIILNDHINNWTDGLNLQNFIELGIKKGNSKLYFFNIGDKLLHHKFCLIDDSILLNGSYNWTYYAEARNIENCILFKGNAAINEQFNAEFKRLKAELESVTIVVPFDISPAPNFDVLSVNSYRSNDLLYHAQEVKQINSSLATRLVRQSLVSNPSNEEASSFQKTLPRPNEHELQEQGIQNSLKNIRTKQIALKAQVEADKALVLEREQSAIARLEEEKRQDHARELKFREDADRQEEQQRQLLEQKQALESKSKLKEQERTHLREINKRQKALKAEQEKAAKEKTESDKDAEQQRLAEKKRQARERRQAELLAAKRATEQQDLQAKAAILETAKPAKLKGKKGELRINLSWTSLDDLDLHVYDPDGNHIHYGDKEHVCQQSLGKLDVDANAESPRTRRPQENIFWSSDPPEGIYSVKVNNYSINQHENCAFLLTVIPAIGDPSVYAGITLGEKNPLPVVKFKYSRSRGLKVISHT